MLRPHTILRTKTTWMSLGFRTMLAATTGTALRARPGLWVRNLRFLRTSVKTHGWMGDGWMLMAMMRPFGFRTLRIRNTGVCLGTLSLRALRQDGRLKGNRRCLCLRWRIVRCGLIFGLDL
jgi:hypothetical protein